MDENLNKESDQKDKKTFDDPVLVSGEKCSPIESSPDPLKDASSLAQTLAAQFTSNDEEEMGNGFGQTTDDTGTKSLSTPGRLFRANLMHTFGPNAVEATNAPQMQMVTKIR